MKDRLKMDIEFYHFAKQRLFTQWKRINDQGLQIRDTLEKLPVFFFFHFDILSNSSDYTVMLVTYINKFFYLIKWSLFSTCLLFFVSRVVTDVNSPEGKIISVEPRVAQLGLDFTLNNVTVGHRPRQVYWLLSSNVNITYPL